MPRGDGRFDETPRFLTALRATGYEPVIEDDTTILLNFPFHRVADARPEVVCRLNHAFVAGLLAGTRTRSRSATLDPADGRCCVLVTPRR